MKAEINILTQELVKIPSVTEDQESCRLALEHIRKYLGKEPVVFQHNGVWSYLWGDKETLMRPRLLLNGHVDVVTANAELFRPKEENGLIYGRGTGDMKGHVASMVHSYKMMIDRDQDRGIGLLLTSDEEMGGFNGTRHVINQGLAPDVVFVPDGAYNFDIVESQKAPHHFVIRASEKGGHASQAHNIVNPVDRVLGVYSEMREKYHLASPKDDWKSTFTMTVIGTDNDSKNRIPAVTTAAFSWRWPPEQHDYEEGRKDMQQVCKEYDCEIIEEEGGGEGCLTDRDAEYVTEWKTTIEGVIGQEVGFQNMHGATDGRHFYNSEQHGTKKVLVTSAITEGHHADDEWVDLDSLVDLAEAINTYKEKLFSQ
jgi:succinyl-diaminopimelate desuccinylase